MRTLSDKPKVCWAILGLILVLISSIASGDVIGHIQGSIECSEPVVNTPLLKFQDSSGQVYPVLVAGSVPGASFTFKADIHDMISDGTAEFFFASPLIDRAGNEGTEITEGKDFSVRVLPKARIVMTVLVIDGKVLLSGFVED